MQIVQFSAFYPDHRKTSTIFPSVETMQIILTVRESRQYSNFRTSFFGCKASLTRGECHSIIFEYTVHRQSKKRGQKQYHSSHTFAMTL